MKKIIFTLFLVLVTSYQLLGPEAHGPLGQVTKVFAATKDSAPYNTNVSANIGEYTLSLTGFIAPYASVVLSVNDTVLRSTAADANGYFSLSDVQINRGLTSFCLDAIDVKRLGESYTCFTIPPASGPVTMNNIFLPPTVGLQISQVNLGDNAVVWGYSMRNATVTLHLSGGKTFTAKADSNGFYKVTFKTDTSGTIEIYADAVYQGQQSLKPARNVPLLVLSQTEQIKKVGENIWQKIWEFLLGNPWGVFWLSIPIFILIFILLRKLFPEWFTWIERGEDNLAAHIPFFRRKLHHWWFVGY